MSFKVGDEVRLKGKGPVMVIDEIFPNTSRANCVWSEGRENKRESYSLLNLEKYDPEAEEKKTAEFWDTVKRENIKLF